MSFQPIQQMLAEIAASTLLAAQALMTYMLLASAPLDRIAVLEWTLLPGLGAMTVAVGAFCFNTQPEIRRVVLGRSVFTLFIGIVGARLLSMTHPWIQDLLADPFLKIGMGGLLGFSAWMISKPFCARAYERAPFAARIAADAIEARVAEKVANKVAEKAASVAEPLAAKVEAVAEKLAEKSAAEKR